MQFTPDLMWENRDKLGLSFFMAFHWTKGWQVALSSPGFVLHRPGVYSGFHVELLSGQCQFQTVVSPSRESSFRKACCSREEARSLMLCVCLFLFLSKHLELCQHWDFYYSTPGNALGILWKNTSLLSAHRISEKQKPGFLHPLPLKGQAEIWLWPGRQASLELERRDLLVIAGFWEAGCQGSIPGFCHWLTVWLWACSNVSTSPSLNHRMALRHHKWTVLIFNILHLLDRLCDERDVNVYSPCVCVCVWVVRWGGLCYIPIHKNKTCTLSNDIYF